MLWMILIPIIAAGLVPWLCRMFGRSTVWIAALLSGGIAIHTTMRLPIEPGDAWSETRPWVPSLGIDLAFRMDGLSAVFVLLISGIGALILIYAGSYMKTGLVRLLGLMLLFMGAMLGIVLSDDLFVLFIFWELTSVASFLLIGFKHDQENARASARQALLVTGAGGLALLAGIILLTNAALQSGLSIGTASKISALIGSDVSTHSLFLPAMILIMIGALSKSAQVPLHFWLPDAMTAPTPVSAYLHSATMVKAGVYLLARLNPLFGHSATWHVVLVSTGAFTMLIGALIAAGQTDMKRILAYTTVSVLGTLTMLIGIGTDLAIKAAVVYLTAHACYKAALFMIAGSIEYITGTRDIQELGGLSGAMPISTLSGILAAMSMAGAPPLFGFIGKELLLKAKLNLNTLGIALICTAVVANIFLIAMALAVAAWPFFSQRKQSSRNAREVHPPMLIGPFVLAVAGLFVGMIPDVFDRTLGSAMASSIGGRTILMDLELWHGFSPVALTALGISFVTLGCGFALFLHLRYWLGVINRIVGVACVYGPARVYEIIYTGILTCAGKVTHITQSKKLSQDLRTILVFFIAISAYPLIRTGLPDLDVSNDMPFTEVVIGLVLLAGAVAAVHSRSRLSAIALLGVSGVLIAVLFGQFSAADLAITQIMVEALTVVLLVLAFYRLPKFAAFRERSVRWLDAIIALAAGAVMATMLYQSSLVRLPASVSEKMASLARPEAYGRNVVNVILVDFRALDTLGELTVVASAGLGVFALIRMGRSALVKGGEA